MANTLYEQVADELITRIEGGYYSVGQKLPSIRDLSKEYGVSISTVQEAYRLLEVRSFTEIRPKSGHFVKARNTQLIQPEIRPLPQQPVEISAWHDIMTMLEADDAGDVLNLGWAVPDLDSPHPKTAHQRAGRHQPPPRDA